ncbi:MAG: hypothetical protein AAF518_03200 [Spirochaetota bacterium]
MNCQIKLLIASVFFLCYYPIASQEKIPNLQFQIQKTISSTGYFQSKWKNPQNTAVQVWLLPLQSDAKPHLLYRGSGESAFMSGLANGIYRLQLKRASDSSLLSESSLRVEHYSLQQALWFLLIGAVLFLSICAFLLYWHLSLSVQRGEHG